MPASVAMPAVRQNRSKLAPTCCQASSTIAAGATPAAVVDFVMALLSFADSAPRAYRLKVGNAYLTFSTSTGASPELARLKGLVTGMGELTGVQLQAAIGSTEGPDSKLADNVIQREPEANRMMHEIDNLVIRVLALRQPWAIDLREVLSASRIAIELERICDHV